MYFDFHGLFKIRMEGNNKRILDYFKKDYAYFLTEDEEDVDLNIIVSDFEEDLRDCFIVEQSYYVKKNFIFSKDSRKLVKWKYCIKDIEMEHITINFNGGLFSELFLREYLIEPLMAFKLLEKEQCFLHGSGVAFDDSGVVFTASKGVGKTTTLLNLIDDGATCLSNEPIILSSEGKVYSFPASIRLYYYNFKGNPSFWRKLNRKQRIEAILKYLTYELSLGSVSLPLNVDPYQLFDNVGSIYPLKSLILLNKSFDGDVEISKKVDIETLVKKLVNLNKFEMFYFEKILNAYSYIFPEFYHRYSREIQENILKKALLNANCCEIKLPSSYSPDVYNNILSHIEQDIGKNLR